MACKEDRFVYGGEDDWGDSFILDKETNLACWEFCYPDQARDFIRMLNADPSLATNYNWDEYDGM